MLRRVVDRVRLRHLSINTERTYCHHISSYIDWLIQHGRPLSDSLSRIEAYLTAIAHRGCSASTQNQAFNALLFLYSQVRGETIDNIRALRARQPRHQRTALPKDTTLQLLATVPNISGYPTHLVARMLYGMGLRVSEPLNLRIKDLDLAHSRLVIRGAKGGKDRVVRVPCSLMPEITAQVKHARLVFERDQLSRLPVQVPGRLAIKYKNAPHSWQWFWLFPAQRACKHPRTGASDRIRSPIDALP